MLLGGTQSTVTGQPVREVRYAANAPPLRTDPNGTCQMVQLYVQWAGWPGREGFRSCS